VIKIDKVLVATDFSEPSDAAVLYGKNFARAYGASLHLLHIVDDVASRIMTPAGPVPDIGRLQMEMEGEAQRRLDELLTDEERKTLRAQLVALRSSTPAHTILAYARDEAIDLIIVGTHGRSGLGLFFMGSVAQHIVRAAPCPVLTVRHPEREFTRPDALQRITAAPERPAVAG